MSKASEEAVDFEKICRLCLVEKRSMSSIFSSKQSSDSTVPLSQRIMTCASVVLYEGDGLPGQICSKCLSAVNQSYAFREQVEAADVKLQEMSQRLAQQAEETVTTPSVAAANEHGRKVVQPKSEELILDEDESSYKWRPSMPNHPTDDNKGGLVETDDIESVDDEKEVKQLAKRGVVFNEDVGQHDDGSVESKHPRIFVASQVKNDNFDRSNDSIDDEKDVDWTSKRVRRRLKASASTRTEQTAYAAPECEVILNEDVPLDEHRFDLSNYPDIIFDEDDEDTVDDEKDEDWSSKWVKRRSKAGARSKREPSDATPAAPMDAETMEKKQNLIERRYEIHRKIKECAQDAGDGKFFCKKCKIFIGRQYFYNHIKYSKNHGNYRDYLCQQCGYRAHNPYILRTHTEAVHTGIRVPCTACSRTFSAMRFLKRHMSKDHSNKKGDDRPVICQFCGRRWKSKTDLRKHIRVHTKEAPFKCQYCERAFSFRSSCRTHERLHTGEKPYTCTYCSEAFTQNCVRKNHEFRVHGNEAFNPKNREPKTGYRRERKDKGKRSGDLERSGSVGASSAVGSSGLEPGQHWMDCVGT